MSILKVANVHLNTTATNRVEYRNDDILRIAGSGNVVVYTGETERLRIDNAGTVTAANIATTGTVSMGYSFMRNKIINGDMRIDQRWVGAANTPVGSAYTLDRWSMGMTQASKMSFQRNAGSVTPPVGFTNYYGVTSTSAYTLVAADIFIVRQYIEGYNVSDLGWGAVGALPITVSFWVRSSLSGSFGGSIQNSALNRSYPFTYTINSPNVWEYKTVTIPGDTTGTWVTDTGIGMALNFNMGTGSTYSGTAGAWGAADYRAPTGATSIVSNNAATWYITGVQLEAGTVATPFERRHFGQELALCQRYFQSYLKPLFKGIVATTVQANRFSMNLPVRLRAAPAAGGVTLSGTLDWYDGAVVGTITALGTVYPLDHSIEFDAAIATGTPTVGRPCYLYVGPNSGTISINAEL